MGSSPLSRWVILLDIEDIVTRHSAVQAGLHQAVYRTAESALTEAGVDLGQCSVQERGNGLLILLPDSAAAPVQLLREFVQSLDHALMAHRAVHNDDYRMRLRVGLHHGLVVADSHGWAGAAIDHLARLVDAEPVKQALAHADRAHLVLVVADGVYQQVVQGGYGGIDPAVYGPTEFVTQHGQTLRGWITLPGYPAPPGQSPVRQASRQGESGRHPAEDPITTQDLHTSGSGIHSPDHTTLTGHTPPGPLLDPDDDWPRETPEP